MPHKGVQLFKTLLLCGKNTPLGIEIPCCSRAEQAPKKAFKKIYKNILKVRGGYLFFILKIINLKQMHLNIYFYNV
ncbi:hypothetical protein UM834_14705 (plasmid) [Staphylococcus aureus]|nr:hypothetical protein UM834_14705 [Staphylococcus aureus]